MYVFSAIVLIFVALAAAFVAAWFAGVFEPRRRRRYVVVDGRTRRYVAWFPPQYQRGTDRLLVVLAFHAAWSTPEAFEKQAGLQHALGANRFMIVYPEGYKRSWNL